VGPRGAGGLGPGGWGPGGYSHLGGGARGPGGPRAQGWGSPAPWTWGFLEVGEEPGPLPFGFTQDRSPGPPGLRAFRSYGPTDLGLPGGGAGPLPFGLQEPGPFGPSGFEDSFRTKLLFIWRRPPYGWCYWKFIPIRALAPNP
jgi:hypothetical protein